MAIETNIDVRDYYIDGVSFLKLKPTSYPTDTNNNQTCTCLISNQCIRPQGFYCQDASCYHMTSLPNQTVPGLVLGCFPVNSLLLSTFECFYNQSCIQMLYDWRLFEIADVVYPLTLNVTPLDADLPSRFSPTTTLDVIVSSLLVEEWINTTDVEMHYERCKPAICTYIYTAGFETIYVITTIFGLLGGLFLILRLSTPLIIQLSMEGIRRRRARRIRPANQATSK